MGVYIKRYGDYVMIGSQVPQESYEWYDGEIPQLTDYDLQYHKWQDGKIIDTQKDLKDYQTAIQEYKNKTIEYKNKKEQIEKATKEEDLINIIEELK